MVRPDFKFNSLVFFFFKHWEVERKHVYIRFIACLRVCYLNKSAKYIVKRGDQNPGKSALKSFFKYILDLQVLRGVFGGPCWACAGVDLPLQFDVTRFPYSEPYPGVFANAGSHQPFPFWELSLHSPDCEWSPAVRTRSWGSCSRAVIGLLLPCSLKELSLRDLRGGAVVEMPTLCLEMPSVFIQVSLKMLYQVIQQPRSARFKK